jgi:hypothetical protein
MGNSNSGNGQSGHHLLTNENENSQHQQNLVLTPELKERYDTFLANLSRLDLYSEHFKFDFSKNFGLTKQEFNEICDLYSIPKAKRFGSQGYSVSVVFQQDGFVKKSILFFIRQSNNKYNVLIAEATQVSGLSWTRAGTAGIGTIAVSLILGFCVNPFLGWSAFTLCSLTVAGKGVYDYKHHQFTDVVVGYMISELQKSGALVFRDSHCYIRDEGQLVRISDLSD